MGRSKKEIRAVLHLPDNEQALRQFEKKICDFYAAQVERKLHSLPKDKKIEIVDALIANYESQNVHRQNKRASVKVGAI